jgi:putative protease
MKLPKLLAPVGNFEMLSSALNAGADEVYFGVGSLNMRAGTKQNFVIKDLDEISKRCQAKKVLTNLTLNTVMFDEDLKNAKEVLLKAKQSKIDVIIAMDIAVMKMAHEMGLEVHASVQAGITNLEAVRHYAQFVDRVVLARECDLDKQKYICEQIKEQKITGPKGNLIEVEVFVHGALCVAVSGKCGMSLLQFNRSANRGQCAQPCRRSYKVTDKLTGQSLEVDNEYVMSSADLCTIGFLDKLVDTGVNVLKIEGRGRNAEYVDMVVKTYKTALESIQNKDYTKEKIDMWRESLEKVYNRGLSEGYYLGKDVKEWSGIAGSKGTESKQLVGEVCHIYPKAGVVQVKVLSNEFEVGSEIYIIGEDSGVQRIQISKIVNEKDQEIKKAKKGEKVTIKIDSAKVTNRDKVYLVVKTT